jgi:hypothetical protein
MSKLTEGLAYGLVSARGERHNLQRALTKEWRAIRIAEQDRAHLATIAEAPLIHLRPVPPSVTFSRSVQPPARD